MFITDAAIGTISLDGSGNFTLTESAVNGSGASQNFSGNGTYSENVNCSLSLTFATPITGTNGALTPPASFNILLGTSSAVGGPNSSAASTGVITYQPTAGVYLPGIVISQ
jgi:hypothetical protein